MRFLVFVRGIRWTESKEYHIENSQFNVNSHVQISGFCFLLVSIFCVHFDFGIQFSHIIWHSTEWIRIFLLEWMCMWYELMSHQIWCEFESNLFCANIFWNLLNKQKQNMSLLTGQHLMMAYDECAMCIENQL